MAERRAQMLETAESYRWLLKDKLISMDNVARAMVAEMKTMGAKRETIAEYLPEFFRELASEVVSEQSNRYDGKGKPA